MDHQSGMGGSAPWFYIATLACAVACTSPPESKAVDSCKADGGKGALSTCLAPTESDAYYIEQSHLYFNTMDSAEDRDVGPAYAEQVARWEWPPWLKLTGFGRDSMVASDLLLRAYPSTIPTRDCRAFDEQPFGRCYVTFFYDAHDGKPCPIYEEFTFNEAGEVTFIEAWSDLPDFLPMGDPDDTWAEGSDVHRLSTRIPGLGSETGSIVLDGSAMQDAAEEDVEVADFVERAHNWQAAWTEEVAAAGDDLWDRGCGW